MTLLGQSPPSRKSLQQVATDPERVAELHGLVGEFCHLLRNRLNSLHVSMYLARKGKSEVDAQIWEELNHHYRETEGVVELFQTVVRPMTLAPIPMGLDIIVEEFVGRWMARCVERGVRLSTDLNAAGAMSWVDASKLGQGLDALASWRINRAAPGSEIAIRARTGPDRSRLEWSETTIPGRETEGELALAALVRIVSAHQGTMTRDVSEGWRIVLDWPHTGLD